MALLSADWRQIRICAALALLAWAWSISLSGQAQSNSQGKQRRTSVQESFRTAHASRVDHAPRLDGTLDDPLWQQATPIDNFLQREPFEGQPPTEHTDVRILYSKHEVYFGITCLDSDPSGIFASELRRVGGRILGSVRQLPDELLVLALPDALDLDSDEHFQHPGCQRQYSLARELSSR